MDKSISDQVDKILTQLRSGAVVPVSSAKSCGCRDTVDCQCAVQHEPEVVDHFIECGACRISSTLGISPAKEKIGRLIDHTLLKPDATSAEIDQLCAEAAKYCFASVCVNPCWVMRCAKLLHRSGVVVCTVVGFPLGATSTQAKALETQTAVSHGAQEIDMVINVGWLKSGEYDLVKRDIHEVVRHAGRQVPVKVILETCLLTDEEKIKACLLAKEAGASYVKTSTGFSKGGATSADVALMRKVVGTRLGVKASGGVRSYEDALAMVESGATRIGASASVKIVSGKPDGTSSY
ncbi:MAG: deoxyribose-phosphate aldolase [Bacteroidetes bacterium]|nr:deoxyribose-phosphate aldolase [Bacteroidota bacterium]